MSHKLYYGITCGIGIFSAISLILAALFFQGVTDSRACIPSHPFSRTYYFARDVNPVSIDIEITKNATDTNLPNLTLTVVLNNNEPLVLHVSQDMSPSLYIEPYRVTIFAFESYSRFIKIETNLALFNTLEISCSEIQQAGLFSIYVQANPQRTPMSILALSAYWVTMVLLIIGTTTRFRPSDIRKKILSALSSLLFGLAIVLMTFLDLL